MYSVLHFLCSYEYEIIGVLYFQKEAMETSLVKIVTYEREQNREEADSENVLFYKFDFWMFYVIFYSLKFLIKKSTSYKSKPIFLKLPNVYQLNGKPHREELYERS